MAPTPIPTLLRVSLLDGTLLTLSETVPVAIGSDILDLILRTQPESMGSLGITGFPVGSTVSFLDDNGNRVSAVVADSDYTLQFTSSSVSTLFESIESLEVLPGPIDASNNEFELEVEVTSRDNPNLSQTVPLEVQVLSQAQMPLVGVILDSLVVTQGSSVPVLLNPTSSLDLDGSEILSLQLRVASDSTNTPIGTLALRNPIPIPGISFDYLGDGLYEVQATGETRESREAALDLLFSNAVVFHPRDNAVGIFSDGIYITAISTETSKC